MSAVAVQQRARVPLGRRVRMAGRSTLLYVAALAFAAFVCGPFAWALFTSVKTRADIFTTPPTWWPHALTGEHYAAAAEAGFPRAFGNSALICTGTTVLCMALALLACYPLTRPGFRGRSSILGTVLVSQLLPHAVLLLPLYTVARDLDMLNTRWGLMTAMLAFNLPVGIWLLRGFLSEVPASVEEAARVDGLTQFRAYWTVAVPLSLPGILAVAVYVFFTSWQDFVFAMVFLADPDLGTAPLAVLGLMGQYSVDWGLLMAASTVTMVPVLALFALVQRHFVGGLAAGAVKG